MSDAMIKYVMRSVAGMAMIGIVGFLLISSKTVPDEAWLFLVGIYGAQQLFDGLPTVRHIRNNGGEL